MWNNDNLFVVSSKSSDTMARGKACQQTRWHCNTSSAFTYSTFRLSTKPGPKTGCNCKNSYRCDNSRKITLNYFQNRSKDISSLSSLNESDKGKLERIVSQNNQINIFTSIGNGAYSEYQMDIKSTKSSPGCSQTCSNSGIFLISIYTWISQARVIWGYEPTKYVKRRF